MSDTEELRKEGGGRMSIKNDLALAYHMGYDDALAKRKPDAGKTQILTPYDLATENAKLLEAVATAIKVQAVLCGDADGPYCRKDCPLHRQESDDCLACDVIGIAQELGIEVD